MFKITTHTGQYKIRMRQSYTHIKSEKQLIDWLQKNINIYKEKSGWEGYAKSLQDKLDKKEIHDIASLWGIFNKSVRL